MARRAAPPSATAAPSGDSRAPASPARVPEIRRAHAAPVRVQDRQAHDEVERKRDRKRGGEIKARIGFRQRHAHRGGGRDIGRARRKDAKHRRTACAEADGVPEPHAERAVQDGQHDRERGEEPPDIAELRHAARRDHAHVEEEQAEHALVRIDEERRDRPQAGRPDEQADGQPADEQHDALARQDLGQCGTPSAPLRAARARKHQRHDDRRNLHRRQHGGHETLGRTADRLDIGDRRDERDRRDGPIMRRYRGRIHRVEPANVPEDREGPERNGEAEPDAGRHRAEDLRERSAGECCTALEADREQEIDRHRRIDLVGKAQIAADQMGDDPECECQHDRGEDAVSDDLGRVHASGFYWDSRKMHAENRGDFCTARLWNRGRAWQHPVSSPYWTA